MSLQPALGVCPAGDETDRELLQRFAALRDDSAFALLVQRHGAMVLRVCRRVLPCAQDAEDVCQATFLTLARKATSIAWQDSVRCWLHGVARRLALQAGRSAARRARRAERSESGADLELAAVDPAGAPLEEVARRELRRVLHEELGRLPAKYRAPVVLCYLEGKTNEQAAGELGWPAGSMSRRLARARVLLRDRLSRRGIALAFAVAGVTLALWQLWMSGVPGDAPARFGATMTCFVPSSIDRPPAEHALLRLVRGAGLSTDERELLRRIAEAPVDVGDKTLLRRNVVDLNQALEDNDAAAARAAARRLVTTCQSCHTTLPVSMRHSGVRLPLLQPAVARSSVAAIFVQSHERRAVPTMRPSTAAAHHAPYEVSAAPFSRAPLASATVALARGSRLNG